MGTCVIDGDMAIERVALVPLLEADVGVGDGIQAHEIVVGASLMVFVVEFSWLQQCV